MNKNTPELASRRPNLPVSYATIHKGIIELLNAARYAAARNVNALMTASYWEIGRRIVEAEQQGKRRAGYGEQLIERLSADLSTQFGRGFGVNNLENMRRFFLAYPRYPISQTLSGKLDKRGYPSKTPRQYLRVSRYPNSLRRSRSRGRLMSDCWRSRTITPANSTKPRHYAEVGACASLTGRLAVNSTSARPCPGTRPRC